MSLQAYHSVAQRTEAPRETEYRLFGEVTRALIEASAVDESEFETRMKALHWNRRLWTALATDCMSEGNQLPIDLRARIVTLSRWVAKHSDAVMRGDEIFDPLINVNRLIMQGLSTRPEAA